MTDESAKTRLEMRACGSQGTPLQTWSTSASCRLLAALSWVNRDLRSSLEQGSEPGVGTCKGEGPQLGEEGPEVLPGAGV